MLHDTTLLGTLIAGLVVAFLMGALALRLRISPIAGYLLAGVLVGPFTPGYVADTSLALQLAEVGVILLMFGVGLHFSLKDLLSVRRIAVPGALVQMGVASSLGIGLGLWQGWSLAGSAVFGLSLSVASTVVLLRALQARNLIETEKGRIAVGWLIVEDLAMVLALVLLPALFSPRETGADPAALARSAGLVVLKVAAFGAFMLVVGRKLLPWLLHWVAHSGSRELFRLAVLSMALGVAYGAAIVFDVSFALGAFFAGMILGETQLSRRAAEETLPLRDAFAVLFFVAVGMLFDPMVIIEQPGPVVATLAIIVVGKSLAAYGIVRGFGHNSQTAAAISASLAQIGEFSFILAGLGTALGVMPTAARDLILAGAILSILLNPLLFSLWVRRVRPEASEGEGAAAVASRDGAAACAPVIIVGFGRVGKHAALQLSRRGHVVVVIEDQNDIAEAARTAGFAAITGNATLETSLRRAGVADASTLLVAIPEGVEAGAIVRRARALNPGLRIVARAHSDEEVADLMNRGADEVVMAEREAAIRMAGAVQPA